MVRKTFKPAPRTSRYPERYPLHTAMTEAEAFAALRDELYTLRDRVAAMEEERSNTPLIIPTPEPPDSYVDAPPPPPLPPSPPPPSPPLPPFKEPKIGEPPTFDGKTAEFPTFLQQCKLYIRMKPITFREHDDESRVAFILSRLRGVPAEWGQALLESNSPLLTDYDLFLERLTALYLNRERRTQLEDKLARLKQTGSASAFSAEFSTLCEILEYPLDTRMGDFRLKLKPSVQGALAMLPAPANFNELVERVVRLDHAQYSLRKSENANSSNASSSSNKSSSQRQHSAPSNSTSSQPKNASSQSSQSSRQPTSPPGPTKSSSSHPSYHRGPLSPEEKARRIALHLCVYCGNSKHTTDECPLLNKKDSKRGRPNDSPVPTASILTVIPPTSGNPPPQDPRRQDH